MRDITQGVIIGGLLSLAVCVALLLSGWNEAHNAEPTVGYVDVTTTLNGVVRCTFVDFGTNTEFVGCEALP